VRFGILEPSPNKLDGEVVAVIGVEGERKARVVNDPAPSEFRNLTVTIELNLVDKNYAGVLEDKSYFYYLFSICSRRLLVPQSND